MVFERTYLATAVVHLNLELSFKVNGLKPGISLHVCQCTLIIQVSGALRKTVGITDIGAD